MGSDADNRMIIIVFFVCLDKPERKDPGCKISGSLLYL